MPQDEYNRKYDALVQRYHAAEERIAQSCRLEGIMVGQEQILKAMDDTIAPKESSTVLPIRQKNLSSPTAGIVPLRMQLRIQTLRRFQILHLQTLLQLLKTMM